MKYNVVYTIEEKYVADIEADSIQEAMNKAKAKYLNVDFKTKLDSSCNRIMVCDENGFWDLEVIK